VRPYWAFPPPLPAMAVVGRRAWPELLHPPPPFPVRALHLPSSRDARAPSLAPQHGRCWPPDGEQRHRPTIPTGELPLELPCYSGLAHWVRLGAGSVVVRSPSLEISPATSLLPVSAAPAPGWLTGVPAALEVTWCGCTGPGACSISGVVRFEMI
jgi:hypothetical protein